MQSNCISNKVAKNGFTELNGYRPCRSYLSPIELNPLLDLNGVLRGLETFRWLQRADLSTT